MGEEGGRGKSYKQDFCSSSGLGPCSFYWRAQDLKASVMVGFCNHDNSMGAGGQPITQPPG